MNVRAVRALLSFDAFEQLDRESKLRLLRACGVCLDVEGGIWSAKVGRCGIASPNEDDVIEIALALLKTRRDLWPTWSPPILNGERP